jgi:hypothetical protein
MATLAEPGRDFIPGAGGSPGDAPEAALTIWENGSWGLLLIPILVCVAMLIFAVASQALPAQSETQAPTRPCVASYEPRPAGTGC